MQEKNKKLEGFTIIELVVVIAIIAILAAIVLTSVFVYIGKAKDTATKANIAQIAKELQMYYINNNEYTNFSKPDVAFPCLQTYWINSDTNNFSVYAQLCTNNKYWCVDSSGEGAELTTVPATASCVEGEGSYFCSPACTPPETCQQDGSCVDTHTYSCSGDCNSCRGLGSDDYYNGGGGCGEYKLWGWGDASSCCTNYGACTWDTGLNACAPVTGGCSGGANDCGANCPYGDTSGCSYGY